MIPYHPILHKIFCLLNLLNLLISFFFCFNFRYALLSISPHTLIHLCCALHENLPCRPPTTWNKTDQGSQLLCSEIHCHICSEIKFPMSCFQAMTECNRDTKTAHFWETQDTSDGLFWLKDSLMTLLHIH